MNFKCVLIPTHLCVLVYMDYVCLCGCKIYIKKRF